MNIFAKPKPSFQQREWNGLYHCDSKWLKLSGNANLGDFVFYINIPSRHIAKVLNFHNREKKYTFLVKLSNFWKLKVRLNFHFQPFERFLFVCFVLSGVTSQKCRRAPHSKLCQSPSAFQTQGWFECQESHVRNLTSISVCILSRNFPIGRL